jgi:hypothetical protein
LTDPHPDDEISGKRLQQPGPMRLIHCALVASCLAADPSRPHPHQGTLEPFKAGPPPQLTSAEKATLAAGKTVTKTVKLPGMGARAMAIFDVAAPPEMVWASINDLPRYASIVSGVTAVEVYEGPKTISGGGTRSKASFTLSFLGYKLTYYLDLKFEPKLDSMTFRLDYNRDSDLDDSIGKWHVVPIEGPDGAVHSRISYSASLTLRMWLPKTVVDMLFATTLGKATSWVAPEAKRRLEASGARQNAPGSKTTNGGGGNCRWTWRGRRCTAAPQVESHSLPSQSSPLQLVLDSAMAALGAAFVFGATLKLMTS